MKKYFYLGVALLGLCTGILISSVIYKTKKDIAYRDPVVDAIVDAHNFKYMELKAQYEACAINAGISQSVEEQKKEIRRYKGTKKFYNPYYKLVEEKLKNNDTRPLTKEETNQWYTAMAEDLTLLMSKEEYGREIARLTEDYCDKTETDFWAYTIKYPPNKCLNPVKLEDFEPKGYKSRPEFIKLYSSIQQRLENPFPGSGYYKLKDLGLCAVKRGYPSVIIITP